MYRDLSAMSTADRWGNTGTGVTTQDAGGHPEWYLRNTSGERFTFSAYDYLWAADIGNRSFQERWLANVTAKLKTADWDGVLVDDANPTMLYHYDVGRVAKYPSDAAYSAATGSALAFIGPRLRAQGKLVIPNFGDWRRYRSTVTPWLKYVSGGMEEHFTKYGDSPADGHFTGADWDDQLAVLKQVQSMGKLFLGVAHSSLGDRAAARYGWATMLLAAQARPASRCTTTTRARPGSPSTATTSARRRAGVQGRRRHPPARLRARPRARQPDEGAQGRPLRRPLPRLRPRRRARHGHAAAQRPRPARRGRPAPRRSGARTSASVRRSLRVRVPCRDARCARAAARITVARPRQGRARVVVGRRKVAVRRTAHVRVRLSAKGRTGRRLRVSVRARR